MKKPEIPNNSLKKEIKEIIRLCEKAIPEYGEKASYFEDAVSEEEMASWEEANGVKIPESYKEWLRFSGHCQIRQSVASFIPPKYFNSSVVPDDLVIIGHLTGDGEVLCFSKETGKFVRYFEGEVNDEFDDFKVMLKEVIRTLKDEFEITYEEKLRMLAKLEELRKIR